MRGHNLKGNSSWLEYSQIDGSGNFIAKAVSKDGKCILTIDDSGTVDNSSC